MLVKVRPTHHADVPLPPEVGDVGVAAPTASDVVLDGQRVRARVDYFVGIEAGEGVACCVANVVQARLQRAHSELHGSLDNVRGVFELNPPELEVLPGGDASASILSAGLHNRSQVPCLVRGDDAVWEFQAHHVPTIMPLAAVEESSVLGSLIHLVHVINLLVPSREALRRSGRAGQLIQTSKVYSVPHWILGQLQFLDRVCGLFEFVFHDPIPASVLHHMRVRAVYLGEPIFRHSLNIPRRQSRSIVRPGHRACRVEVYRGIGGDGAADH
mmetsp:Transcript_20407/g.33084  ORF Transcript_20407/g.33084 Transcript_20407/m.33084 type:complete len:271 (-) Transcript_20407:278-1090(-)